MKAFLGTLLALFIMFFIIHNTIWPADINIPIVYPGIAIDMTNRDFPRSLRGQISYTERAGD